MLADIKGAHLDFLGRANSLSHGSEQIHLRFFCSKNSLLDALRTLQRSLNQERNQRIRGLVYLDLRINALYTMNHI